VAELAACKAEYFPQLLTFGAEGLQQGCRLVEDREFGKSSLLRAAGTLVDFLVEYRRHTNIGTAVAANQIGIEQSLVAIAPPGDSFEAEAVLVACNLRLADTRGSHISAESCMSSKTEMVAVVRAHEIIAPYQTLDGQPAAFEEIGRAADRIQHEFAHTLGITCLQEAIPGSLRLLALDGDPLTQMTQVAEEYDRLYTPQLITPS